MAVRKVMAAFVIAIGCAACGRQEVPHPSTKPGDHRERTPPISGDWTIEEAREFDGFALYWIGEQFQGLPLTQIRRLQVATEDPNRPNELLLMYGTCRLPGGLFADGGCSPPITLVLQPACKYTEPRTDVPPKEARTEVPNEGQMNVLTEDVSIEIFTHSIAGGPQAVTNALVSLNGDGRSSPEEPLPPRVTC